MVNPFEGDITPEAAESTASEFGRHVFYMSDAARWTKPKHSRTKQLVAIDNEVYDRDDAARTYSYEDKRFYVVNVHRNVHNHLHLCHYTQLYYFTFSIS